MMTENEMWKRMSEMEEEREAEERGSPAAERDDGRGWSRQVEAAVSRAREEKEAAEAKADLGGGFAKALTSPSVIAEEMARCSGYLRSRPMRGQRGLELEILGELDQIEASARALEARQDELGEVGLALEVEVLACTVYAVRGRYADLLGLLGEPWPARAKVEDPEARTKELADIEAFLERKRARAKTPAPEGK